MYDKYLHTNGAYYAFVDCPETLLDTLIPEEAKWSDVPTGEVTEDDEGNTTNVTRQKTVREFVIRTFPSQTEGNVVFALAAMEADCYRRKSVTAEDLAEWDMYLAASGHDETKWMTLVEFKASLPETGE